MVPRTLDSTAIHASQQVSDLVSDLVSEHASGQCSARCIALAPPAASLPHAEPSRNLNQFDTHTLRMQSEAPVPHFRSLPPSPFPGVVRAYDAVHAPGRGAGLPSDLPIDRQPGIATRLVIQGTDGGLPPYWQGRDGPWWSKAVWQHYLRALLLFRGRRRYSLSISEFNPLGETDPEMRLVRINPVDIAFPQTLSARRRIRHCPADRTAFEQAMAVGLVEHEAGHIRFSGNKPTAITLGWLWNSLEDERQERALSAQYSELIPLFDFVGDAVWIHNDVTDNLLNGCLLYRWEHDRAPAEAKFRPATDTEAALWKGTIVPLIETAWAAPDSDAVVAIATHILAALGLPADSPLPGAIARGLCTCHGGEHAQSNGATGGGEPIPSGDATDAPVVPPGASVPGRRAGTPGGPGVGAGRGHVPDDPAQADPAVLLTEVEGAARNLARWLRPPVPMVRARPHPNRGDLNIERILAGSERPFDAPVAPAPDPSRAWMLLVDESGSMGYPTTTGIPMAGAIRLVMWLDRAADLARVPLGIYGFDAGSQPILIRPLSLSSTVVGQRRIAGMYGAGGTTLAPTLSAGLEALQHYQARRKLLIVIHDGGIKEEDAIIVRKQVAQLRQGRVQLLPLYLGGDPDIIAANTRVFGHVLACPDLSEMTRRLCAWLFAVGA